MPWDILWLKPMTNHLLNSKDSQKVAIIGAGITGLYLARELSEKGYQVTVFEKRDKIGKECCSGLFSQRILEFIPESRKLIQNEIESVLIHFPSPGKRGEGRDETQFQRAPKRTLEVRFKKKFLAMNHFELDNLLANLTQNSGAKILFRQNISRTAIATLSFDKIIGCDGALSEVRKSLGPKEPQYRLGIQGFIQKENYSENVETWPTKNGFIWKIPRGKETEYGIIETPKGAKCILKEFLNKYNLKLERVKSALVPQGLVIPSDSRITLCGDAAGLTKPWSGGGVVWGLLAAQELLKNFPDFLKYKKAVEKFFLPKIIFSKAITKMVYFLGFQMPWLLPKKWQIESDFLI